MLAHIHFCFYRRMAETKNEGTKITNYVFFCKNLHFTHPPPRVKNWVSQWERNDTDVSKCARSGLRGCEKSFSFSFSPFSGNIIYWMFNEIIFFIHFDSNFFFLFMLSLKLKLFTHIFLLLQLSNEEDEFHTHPHTYTSLIKNMVSSIATAWQHYSCSILLPAFSLSLFLAGTIRNFVFVRWTVRLCIFHSRRWWNGMGGVWKIARRLKWKLNRQFGYKFATDEEEIKLFLSFHFIFNLTLKMFQFVLLWLVSRLEVGQSWMRCALSRNRNFECWRSEFEEDDCHHLI